MQQVLPILTGGIGTIGLFDDGPIDFQFLGFFPQGIEEQIVERHSLQIEPPQEFRFRPPHSAGANGQHEEPAVVVSVLQTFLEGTCLGHVGGDFDMSGTGGRGMPARDRRTRT